MTRLVWLRPPVLVLAVTTSGLPRAQTALAAAPAIAPPPPASAFYSRPAIEQAQLSPSGRWLAMLVPLDKLRNALAVVDVDDPQKVKIIANFNDFDIYRVDWVNDNTLVFNVVDWKVANGDRTDAPGLFSIGRDGEGLRQLVQLRRYFVTGGHAPGFSPCRRTTSCCMCPTTAATRSSSANCSSTPDGTLRMWWPSGSM